MKNDTMMLWIYYIHCDQLQIDLAGSNAQRDILTQTLIESALRSKQYGLAQNLVNERSVEKPFSPLTRRFKSKIAQ